MNGYSKAILIGNLTRDPELTYTQGGTAVVKFSLAVNKNRKQGGELKEEVHYFDVVVFGKTAETCGQYLCKGKPVLVEGGLQQSRWETDDGQKRSRVQVLAAIVQFLPDGKGGGRGEDRSDAEEEYYPGGEY